MIFANGENNIYMGTYTASEPTVGELRYIFRLTGLTETYPTYSYGDVSDTAGGTAIEGSDVYTVSGQTRSKFCKYLLRAVHRSCHKSWLSCFFQNTNLGQAG